MQTLQVAVAVQSWGDRVQLGVQPADVADGLPQGRFDVVVLNSVIQYFPSAGYLTDVLAVAMRLLAPGGALFIGDVRNHTLQGAFQTAVALARTTTDIDAAEIRQRGHRAMLGAPELLLAPEFFTTWAAEQPSVAGLDIQVKRGVADNELTRYRYDVTIHKAPSPVRSLAGARTWAWTQCAGLGGLNAQLTSQRRAAVRITEIPRAGVITDVGIEQALAVGQPLPDALAKATPDAVTPEQLHHLGETTGYHVAVTWGAKPGTLDAVFITPTDARHTAALTDLYLPLDAAHHRSTHANDPHTTTKISAVRQRLSTRLPDYMVPARIVVLDEFPLTSSGKIDRKALPAPVFAAAPFRAPQTQTEQVLAGIYARVLGLDRVGVDDSFFDLGGDSLSAMRVLAAINTSFDTQLPVRTLFDASTVGGLADHLHRHRGGTARSPLMVMPRPARVPLSFAQGRLWFLDRFEGGVATYNIPTAFRISGALDVEALGAALDDVIARHESLRTIFPDIDGVPFQEVLPAQAGMWRRGGAAVISMPEQDVADELVALAGYRFDLSAEIPIRGQIYSVGPEQYVVGIVVHHIAFDGWSLAPMARDVGEAYQARRQGRTPQSAPLPVQYVDYTLWQRELFGDLEDSDSPIAAQLHYWQDALAGMPELQLPTDRPYPLVADYRGANVAVDWPAELQQRVREVAREHNATSFMVIQTALAMLLSKISASSDVAVGFPIAGRNDPALGGLVGFFVNTSVLRVDLSGDPTVAELLAQVRRRSLTAFEHQDVPFEVLVERLNPTRSLTHHPLIQVMLAWQNVLEEDRNLATGLSLGDLQVTQVPMDTHTARMDLVFHLSERWTEAGEPAGIGGTVEFRTDVFDAESIQVLIERWRRVLVEMTTDPTRRLSSMDVLDAGEHIHLDVIGNRAVLTQPAPTPV
jgi:acyl carrier protein